MLDKILFSFGCSWTYGKYIHIQPGQKKTDLINDHGHTELKLANTYAYRSLIAEHFGMDQKVFAAGASSNQKQFRLASQYFLRPDRVKSNNAKLYANTYQKVRDKRWPSVEEFKFTGKLPPQILDELINGLELPEFEIFKVDNRQKYVIWFITSTARIEFFDAQQQEYKNDFLTWSDDSFTKMYASRAYDHNHELECLAYSMNLWNVYFESQGIKNIWIDTFNHHDYPIPVKNYIKLNTNSSDIMSAMCIKLGYTNFNSNEYHNSSHSIDDTRSEFLVNQGMLNPESLHPTVKGHQLIYEILIPFIEEKFNRDGT